MAKPSYTTTELVNNVLLLAHVPLSNATFDPEDILAIADFEGETSVVSQIISVREGYFQTYIEYDQAEDGRYPVPAAAIAGAITNVQIRSGQALLPVNRVDQAEQFATNVPTANSYAYYIEGNEIVVIPFNYGGVLRVSYLRAPSKLVKTTSCAKISAIAGDIVTVEALPSSFGVDTEINEQQDQPQFNWYGPAIITDINTFDLTLDFVNPKLQVGDWLTPPDQTCVPQIQKEFRPLLEQRVVVKIYELQGYFDKMKVAQDKLKEMEEALFKLITPRNSSQTRIINPNNGGLMSGNKGMKNNWMPTRNN